MIVNFPITNADAKCIITALREHAHSEQGHGNIADKTASDEWRIARQMEELLYAVEYQRGIAPA